MSPGRRGRGDRRGLVVRLRRWVLGTALVLLVSLAGIIGYARHRARKALLDLPHLLGADIRSETNGFTYSQSVKGRTLFTIHAAKAIQRQNGKVTLHDVQVTLYGEPGSNRVDSIRGAEFEYDQPNGVVRAMGETQLDLASPVAGKGLSSTDQAKRISVKATGLVFLEKLGVAATDGPIHFEYGTMAGDARGADYDADMGLLQLRHDVHLQSHENGHLEQADAASANLDRMGRTVTMQDAVLRDADDILRARTLNIKLRPENARQPGAIQSAVADGGADLTYGHGNHVTGRTMVADWASGERPRDVKITGDVQIQTQDQGNGTAGEAQLALNAAGHPSRITLLHNVRLATAPHDGNSRLLTADTVVGNFMQEIRPVLKDLVATGTARLVITEPSKRPGQPVTTTTLTAQTLQASGSMQGGRWHMQQVEGEDSTRIQQAVGTTLTRSSSGDHLLATFETSSTKSASPAGMTGDISGEALKSVVQQGHVVIEEQRSVVPASSNPGTSTATGRSGNGRASADRAEYIASTGRTVLTGSPQISTSGMQVAADVIGIERITGNAEANGNVRGTYLSAASASAPQQGAAEPVHFIASRTTLDRAAQRAAFYGGASPARLWSGTGQVEAPVIELDQKSGTLLAHGAAGSEGPYPVRTVLASAQNTPGKPDAIQQRSGGPIRIFSRSLDYRQGTPSSPGSARFNGGVRLDGPAGQVVADEAVAELRPAGKAAGLMRDAVQSIVAEHHVRLRQPGRVATAERLQYTTADQQFLLTGTGSNLPVVTDSIKGSVTGSRLIFHAGDDSVEVAGDAGQPVHNDVIVVPRKATGHPGDLSHTHPERAAGTK